MKPSKTNSPPVLVIGIGNVLRADDGVGVRVVEYLGAQKRVCPEEVELVDGGAWIVDLFELIEDRRCVIVVDALQGPGKPGSIHRFTLDSLARPCDHAPVSLHEAGIWDVWAMIGVLGEAPHGIGVGIVPADVNSLGSDLSPCVREAIPRAASVVLALIAEKNRSTQPVEASHR